MNDQENTIKEQQLQILNQGSLIQHQLEEIDSLNIVIKNLQDGLLGLIKKLDK